MRTSRMSILVEPQWQYESACASRRIRATVEARKANSMIGLRLNLPEPCARLRLPSVFGIRYLQ
jgi:hypothetical protein